MHGRDDVMARSNDRVRAIIWTQDRHHAMSDKRRCSVIGYRRLGPLALPRRLHCCHFMSPVGVYTAAHARSAGPARVNLPDLFLGFTTTAAAGVVGVSLLPRCYNVVSL